MDKQVRTAAIKAVDSKDVSRTHLRGPADGHVVVGDGNDGRLPVSGEGKPAEQTHNGVFTSVLKQNSRAVNQIKGASSKVCPFKIRFNCFHGQYFLTNRE